MFNVITGETPFGYHKITKSEAKNPDPIVNETFSKSVTDNPIIDSILPE